MELEDIFTEWSVDSKINPLDLSGEAIKIPSLHNKYLVMLSRERSKLHKLNAQYKKLSALKHEYFAGLLNGTDELPKLGWPPFLKTVLKSDIPRYIESDSDIQKLVQLIDNQNEKVEVLTSILRDVMSRNFVLKSAIDWKKYEAGIV